MKVLGISFGRKMKNCEMLVKQALMGAEAAGAEVSFIRTINLDVGHCIACGACSSGMRVGKQVVCTVKDDYRIIEEAILESDAVILAAPVYALGPVGQYKNFLDRFGPAHDRMALESEQEKRVKENKELLDPRVLKRRFVSYISVGGASTQNWVSFGLPGMQLFGFSTAMCPVDQIDAYNMGRSGGALLNPDLMARSYRLGESTAKAIGNDPDTYPWQGDEQGNCPTCHCNLISITGTVNVECPLCGTTGKLSVDGDKVSVYFPESEQKRARKTRAGLLEHYLEIRSMGDHAGPKIAANKEFLESETKKFADYLK